VLIADYVGAALHEAVRRSIQVLTRMTPKEPAFNMMLSRVPWGRVLFYADAAFAPACLAYQVVCPRRKVFRQQRYGTFMGKAQDYPADSAQ
jgi:hypothetical protein